MRKILLAMRKHGAVLMSVIAMATAALSVNSACVIWYHQPKVPEGMEKFKKL